MEFYFTIFEASQKKEYLHYFRKRVDLNHQVLNTIFSKYLALPIATFPLLGGGCLVFVQTDGFFAAE
jgi:hypothetical protein